VPLISETLATALAHHQAGDLVEAAALYRRVLSANPRQKDALHLLGVLEFQEGRNESAIDLIGQAIAIDGRQAMFHNNLAAACRALGRFSEACAGYERAVQLKPDYVDAWSNLSTVLCALGRASDAETACRRAIALSPDFAEAHNNLGNALREQGKMPEAEASYRRALGCRPEYALALQNLGTVLEEQRRFVDAEQTYRAALAINPHQAEALSNLANVLLHAGKFGEARDRLEQAHAVAPRDGLRIRAALALPMIPASTEEVRRERERLCRDVAQLLDQPLSVADPVHEIGVTAMHLAYHGENDRDIQSQIARLFLHAAPVLEFVAPHCREGGPSGRYGRPLRLGVISRHMHDHSNTRLAAGMLHRFRRPEFHVTLVRFPGHEDAMLRWAESGADETVVLPAQLEPARQAIASKQLDVLFYTDIGMEPLTYCLAFSRLAPVQCTTWGVPVTTGIPAIDYYLSSVDLEGEESMSHYSEHLVRLSNLPTYYRRPRPEPPARTRDELGLDHAARLYICPQSLFKLHPEFDETLGRILRADPLGHVILIQGAHPHWTELLRARLSWSISDVVDRIRFLAPLPSWDFLDLLSLADCLLDPFPFGGGNTTFEALALGVPIVTLPGRYLRGRVTAACYRKLGFGDLIAADVDQYVTLALRLATDREFHDESSRRILAAAGAIYENEAVVREMEQFFFDAFDRVVMNPTGSNS
jgi:protein O-GlcNAc transferase